MMTTSKEKKKMIGTLGVVTGLILIIGAIYIVFQTAELKSYKTDVAAKFEAAVAEYDLTEYSDDGQETFSTAVAEGEQKINDADSHAGVKKAYAAAIQSLKDVPNALEEVKAEYTAKLADYYENDIDLDDYSTANQKTIKSLFKEGKAAINAVEKETDIIPAYSDSVTKIDKVEIMLEEVKGQAISDIDMLRESIDMTIYPSSEVIEIIEVAKEEVLEADSKDEITAAVEKAKTEVANMSTTEELTGVSEE